MHRAGNQKFPSLMLQHASQYKPSVKGNSNNSYAEASNLETFDYQPCASIYSPIGTSSMG